MTPAWSITVRRPYNMWSNIFMSLLGRNSKNILDIDKNPLRAL